MINSRLIVLSSIKSDWNWIKIALFELHKCRINRRTIFMIQREKKKNASWMTDAFYHLLWGFSGFFPFRIFIFRISRHILNFMPFDWITIVRRHWENNEFTNLKLDKLVINFFFSRVQMVNTHSINWFIKEQNWFRAILLLRSKPIIRFVKIFIIKFFWPIFLLNPKP